MCYGLKLHMLGRQKNQIGIAQEQGICVTRRRVMEVKLDIAQAVCAHHAEDGVVVPTNSRMNVFTTHDVDNLDGNYSMDEFHGYALSVTNHLSHDNLGQKRTCSNQTLSHRQINAEASRFIYHPALSGTKPE